MKVILIIGLLFLTLNKCECERDSLEDYDGFGGIISEVDGVEFRPSGGGFYGNQSTYFDNIDGDSDFLVLGYSGAVRDTSAYMSVYIQPIDRFNVIGKTFLLTKESENGDNSYARYSRNYTDYNTTESNGGEVTISAFNFDTGVVSGTFWFDAKNDDGNVVKVREGKFDTNFR